MAAKDPNESSFFEQVKVYYQSRHAPPLTRLEENEGSHLATATISIISLLIFIFIIWASLTPIEEIAVTFGEVIPKSKVYTIQHLEGGVIGSILVKEGDEVKPDQILVIFDPTIPKLELEQIQARNAALIASSQYLQGLLAGEVPKDSVTQEGSTPAFAEQSKNNTNISNSTPNMTKPETQQSKNNTNASKNTNTPNMNANKLATSSSKSKSVNPSDPENTNVISSFKEQAAGDLSKFESLLEILKKRLAILIQEKNMYETLLKTGSVSQKDYLALLRTITQVQEDISKTQAARIETQYTINKLEDRINRIEVRSPIHGLVKGLQIHVGNVIAPGGALMDIVPIENLMVETKIPVSDIGHIKIGASVRIKVAAYDYTRYGMIMGKLVNISATTFMDPLGKAPYYKGLIELEKSYVGDKPERNRLLPGMTVQADINTGSKSLLQYLLRPVEILISSSFREY